LEGIIGICRGFEYYQKQYFRQIFRDIELGKLVFNINIIYFMSQVKREVKMENNHFQYIGKGIYSINDVFTFTSVNKRKIRSWMKNSGNGSPKLIQGDYGLIDDTYSLSFLDMIDVLTISRLRDKGVSLQAIRKVYTKLCEMFNTLHPFSMNKSWTDGRGIWIDIGHKEQDKKLLNLLKDRYEFHQIVTDFLDEVDIGKDDFAKRWWPMSKKEEVVIDPMRKFGQPIVNIEGIPTIVIANTAKAEGSISKSANWYGVSIESARSACKFEEQLTKRIAA
jgi:uncharacterized protein (DUF433 family)